MGCWTSGSEETQVPFGWMMKPTPGALHGRQVSDNLRQYRAAFRVGPLIELSLSELHIEGKASAEPVSNTSLHEVRIGLGRIIS